MLRRKEGGRKVHVTSHLMSGTDVISPRTHQAAFRHFPRLEGAFHVDWTNVMSFSLT